MKTYYPRSSKPDLMLSDLTVFEIQTTSSPLRLSFILKKKKKILYFSPRLSSPCTPPSSLSQFLSFHSRLSRFFFFWRFYHHPPSLFTTSVLSLCFLTVLSPSLFHPGVPPLLTPISLMSLWGSCHCENMICSHQTADYTLMHSHHALSPSLRTPAHPA